jgi:hypothetical protein
MILKLTISSMNTMYTKAREHPFGRHYLGPGRTGRCRTGSRLRPGPAGSYTPGRESTWPAVPFAWRGPHRTGLGRRVSIFIHPLSVDGDDVHPLAVSLQTQCPSICGRRFAHRDGPPPIEAPTPHCVRSLRNCTNWQPGRDADGAVHDHCWRATSAAIRVGNATNCPPLRCGGGGFCI